jgi:hypothetical protein
MRRPSLLFGAFLSLVIYEINGYSYMVPQESCINMYPRHNSTNQQTFSPFRIVLEKNHYHPLERLKGTYILISVYLFCFPT